jgi:hypothetical protein
MSRVMDGRAVSRGLCFTLGNPALQPSYLALVVAASLVHAPWRIRARLAASSSFIDASRSSHPLYAIAAYLGKVTPYLVIFASLFYYHSLCYHFNHPRDKT